VKDVFTLSSEDRTVVAGDVAIRTTAIEVHSANAADVVAGDIPFPYCHRVHAFDLDLHRWRGAAARKWAGGAGAG
jgi:hypothetical protein